ncbi:MAG TPA: tripartite tricarboxylate transporter substrate binding protein [Burkholderiales bacterium]|nr:tripartite tricarboxylate transporter substrate binding protein [Burkholderiales bacterium]
MSKCSHIIAAAVLAIAAGVAGAQYPEKPVRIVAPWPPGSTTDGSARIIADALSKRLNQRVLVDNKPGANGTIGSTFVAKSAPDGYTLLMANGDTHSISPHIYKALQYDAIRNFDPVALVATASFVLIARPTLPESSLQEVIAAAKRNPKKMTYGTWGVGSAGHVAFALLESATGIQLTHVPFQGAAPALAALMGGHVDLMIGSPLAAYTNQPLGKVKVLGVASTRRAVPWLPETRTFAELGVKGAESGSWYGIVGPANMPPQIRKRLSTEISAALKDPAVAKQIAAFGWHVASDANPEDFGAFMKAELDRFGAIVKAKGIEKED